MRLDKFTVKSQEAITEAQKKAEELGHQTLENEHLLYALLQEKDGTVRAILEKLGASPDALVANVERELARLPEGRGGGRQVYMGPGLEESARHRHHGGGKAQGRIREHRAPAHRHGGRARRSASRGYCGPTGSQRTGSTRS